IREAVLERRRWIVGIVGVPDVHPYEDRPLAVLLQPGEGARDGFFTAPLHSAEARLAGLFAMETSVVYIESAFKAGRETIFGIKHDRAYKCRGVVAPSPEDCGQIRDGVRQTASKIAHAMKTRVGARKDCGVRDRGKGRLGV